MGIFLALKKKKRHFYGLFVASLKYIHTGLARCGMRVKIEARCGVAVMLMAGCGINILLRERDLLILTEGMRDEKQKTTRLRTLGGELQVYPGGILKNIKPSRSG